MGGNNSKEPTDFQKASTYVDTYFLKKDQAGELYL